MKKNIAVVWGGYSSEIVVSEKSMMGICSFLDTTKYNVFKIKITRDSWTADIDGEIVDVDKNDFSIHHNSQKTSIDFAYITIHGTPGEDGHLQGYLDMVGIKYSSCGMTTSALTMNKFICNKYLKNFDLNVADSFFISKDTKYDIEEIISKLGLPIFVKPNSGGSSFATTKVKKAEDLEEAIRAAFKECDDVIIESFIDGQEVTCGCYKIGDNITALPLTEVVTQNDFFDYNAKYNGEVEEITPARISLELTDKIQKETKKIYALIGAKGIIRADYIIKKGIPYLLEVNTTPGMTVTSFIPQQIKAAGLNITDVFTQIIENETNNR